MVKPGGKSEAIVESIDVYLTLCELTGIPLPDGIDGESLMKNLLDPSHDNEIHPRFSEKHQQFFERGFYHRQAVSIYPYGASRHCGGASPNAEGVESPSSSLLLSFLTAPGTRSPWEGK